MTTNMYRVGDYVYFETSSTSPYQIRRIEELNKTQSGNVEAKVLCFYRRRDLPTPLVQLADKHQMAQSEDSPVAMKLKKMWLKTPVSEEQAAQAVLDPALVALEEERNSPNNNLTEGNGERKGDQLSTKQRHQMKHRELFLSRQLETLPATHIRGKCSVTLLNEEESLLSYLNKDDTFFYCLVFDPVQKTLLADKGEIRVGLRYQTEVQSLLREGEIDARSLSDLETLTWTPNHSLTDRKIDQFLVVSRSVGTFARALDCSSSVKQPSLHMSAAAASRDITLFHAMDTLHKHNYSIEAAMCSLVPSSGPVLCRDEMEEWSASEANLFEEALEKYGKDFNDIRNDFLPWKTLKSIVEYYYMWKTTDRYVQQKRVKAVEAESKLKQVYIPAYTRPSPAIITNNRNILNGNAANGNGNDVLALNGVKPCESCTSTSSSQWYAWGPAHLNCRLCHTCWTYWKRYGGLKVASRLADNDVAGADVAAPIKKRGASSDIDDDRLSQMAHRPHRPIMKTRTAFYLLTNATTRLSRKLCRHLIRSKKAARQPSFAINLAAVKQEYALAITNKSATELKKLLNINRKEREKVTNIANRLGNPGPTVGEWLRLTPRDMMPKPEKVAFPKPPKAPDGTLLYERIPNKAEPTPVPTTNERVPIATQQPPQLRKRHYEEVNGVDNPAPPPTKRPNKDPMPSHRPTPEQYAAMMAAAAAAGQPLPRHHLNGKPKIAQMARTGSGRKQVISWMDAPDDVYFRSTEVSRSARRSLTLVELRRAARKPWRNIKNASNFNLHHGPPALTGNATSVTPSIPPQTQTSINSGDLQVVILD